MQIGVELAFLPSWSIDGFTNLGEVEYLCKLFNSRLTDNTPDNPYIPAFVADRAVFRVGCNLWCIEIHNKKDRYIRNTGHTTKSRIEEVYRVAKDLKLVARKTRTTKGVTKYWPTGGGHLHSSILHFADDFRFLSKLDTFVRNISVDFCNRPYIKWLFSEWFDNRNSNIIIGEEELKRLNLKVLSTDYVLKNYYQSSIIKQYQRATKNSPTIEYRFFDMPRNTRQLIENCLFLDAWEEHHKDNVKSLFPSDGSIGNGKHYSIELTKEQFARWRNEKLAWEDISIFLKSIALDPEVYRSRFEENYLTRLDNNLIN